MASTRNTAVLVAFTALTNLADGATKVALPLMATTLIQSPAQVSGIALTLSLPWLLVALHVGALFGRYSAAARLFSWGAMPIGAGLGGLLAEVFGLRLAFAGFALATALLIVPFLRIATPASLDIDAR